jgi:hypothetical protein
MPSLEFLSRFRVVVWSLNDNRSAALNQKSAWFHMNYSNTTHVLAMYMTGNTQGGEKGKVWAFGRGLVESSLLPDLGIFCAYPYVVDEDMNLDADCGIKAGTFVTERMHITGEFEPSDRTSGGARISLFDEDYGDRPRHVFVDTAGPAIPGDLYTRPPAAELYPNLPRKLARHRDWAVRSPARTVFEVLEYPRPDQGQQHLFYDPVSGQMTNLIPLFQLHTTYTDSPAHKKYCGFKYIPTGPEDSGDFVYFFFPMFIFKDDLIRTTAKVVLSDWFGLPDPDAPGAGPDETALN